MYGTQQLADFVVFAKDQIKICNGLSRCNIKYLHSFKIGENHCCLQPLLNNNISTKSELVVVVLLRIQVLVHMTLSLGAQLVTASFMIINVSVWQYSLTIQLLSICQYSIPTSTSVSKTCFLKMIQFRFVFWSSTNNSHSMAVMCKI
jgi:hypothetical protein